MFLAKLYSITKQTQKLPIILPGSNVTYYHQHVAILCLWLKGPVTPSGSSSDITSTPSGVFELLCMGSNIVASSPIRVLYMCL